MQPKFSFNEALYQVLYKHWSGQPLLPAEQVMFEAWIAEPDNAAVWEELNDEFLLQQQLKEWQSYDAQATWQQFLQLRDEATPVKKPFISRQLFRWSAAAAVFAGIAIGSYVYFQPTSTPTNTTVTQVADVLPGSSKAMLILDDGSTIDLDTAHNQVIQQGSSAAQLQGGSLHYQNNVNSHTIAYNTLKTPRGGQFQLTLPDGSLVWLNAASSIRFPTSFQNAERVVDVTGEVYFEVAQNVNKPFRVNVNKQARVEVLGTSFNIHAYDDAPNMQTTLLAGSVKVSAGVHTALLRPGQQAQLGTGNMRINKNVDIAKVMAWKNGLFDFQDASLQDVMLQLSRWYDVEIEFRGAIPATEFWGKMGRNLTLMQVLKGLEGSGVHFKLENNGKKLIVLPS
ncbi:FecR family protein [Chitinophaga skermanii]|nr:FecR family protein [Chitinophaga skermanii]